MKKYSDPLLLGQYLKYLHEQVAIKKLIDLLNYLKNIFQLVKDAVKFEMLIAAGAIEGLTYYLVNFTPSSIPGKNFCKPKFS